MLVWTQTKLLWAKDFSRQHPDKCYWRDLQSLEVFYHHPSSLSRAPGTLQAGAGVLSPVMEQLIPLPLYIPYFMPLSELSSAAPCLTSSVECLSPDSRRGQSFLNLDLSLPTKGRENSLPLFSFFFF